HIKDVCDRLAADGFVALAPDLFHGKTASTQEPDTAGKLLMEMQLDEAARDMKGAVGWLAASDKTTGNRVGIVGFCMGGGLALLAAADNPTIAAVVAYYPGFGTPGMQRADPTRIKGAVLGHFAREDD